MQSQETTTTNSSKQEPNLKVYKNQPTLNPDGLIDPDRVLDITDGHRFRALSSDTDQKLDTNTDIDIDVDNEIDIEIQAIQTPGHAKDHMSFLVTRSSDPQEIGAIFTADNVLGHGTAVFEDLGVYLDSLALMKRRVVESIAAQEAVSGPNGGNDASENTDKTTKTKKRAYPGHGAVVEDAVAKIDEYIAHRRMREEEALNVLRFGTTGKPEKGKGTGTGKASAHDSITRYGDGDSNSENESEGDGERKRDQSTPAGKEWTSIDMVKVIYRHYPENLYQPAEHGLLMVLEKLRRDGKVVKTPEGTWRASEKAIL
ncbi:hypothetical protein A1O1_03043 [Capronia coronata CBS 617.96]|uniref:LACTB2 winged helix domain-containing protein n=1 Tax=Capronia coronata CBS 617.96 TaxID=1182541 RepID=W9YNY0_9EURO|nr:uncharacterized protein A1O1_03043 [Capronia coronata CBS 617.96]EXJ94647.1 hypothetical protein A1O1_03043 [Capronia coronata CBS 617.96]